MEKFIWRITEKMTLENFLKSMHLSENKIKNLISQQCCMLNNKIIDGDFLLNLNDILSINLEMFDKEIKPFLFHLNVLYEDDYILIIDKPQGFLVHSDGVNDEETLTNMVKGYLLAKNDFHNAYSAHRLDKDTSGCLLFCKDIITLAYFSNAFEEHHIIKKYLAIVKGKTKKEGTIELPIGRNRHESNKMIVAKSGKMAITKYDRVKLIGDYSLLNIELKTGRKHQIRVHFASINHPIVGDLLYGEDKNNNDLLLHCSELTFFHPLLNKKMTIKAQFPSRFDKFCISIEKNKRKEYNNG